MKMTIDGNEVEMNVISGVHGYRATSLSLDQKDIRQLAAMNDKTLVSYVRQLAFRVRQPEGFVLPAEPAIPRFSVGQMVQYRDRQNRLCVGKVLSIEAKWPKWSRQANKNPLITMAVEHPTYRDRRIYINQDEVFS